MASQSITVPGPVNVELLREELVIAYPDLQGREIDGRWVDEGRLQIVKQRGRIRIDWLGATTEAQIMAVVALHNPNTQSVSQILEAEAQEARAWLRLQYKNDPNAVLQISAVRLIALLGLPRVLIVR